MRRLVSIIIPCFNAERVVGDAIRSALRQSHKETEIIVVDDHSSDSTVAIVERFGSRVSLMRTDADRPRGPSAARNVGIQAAKGDYTQFLDADDILHPKKIEVCLAESHCEDEIVFCDKVMVQTKRVALGRRIRRSVRALPTKYWRWRWVNRFSTGGGPDAALRVAIGTPAPLHRTRVLMDVGGFDEDLWNLEDVELHLRITLSGIRFKRTPHVLVTCRQQAGETQLRHAARNNERALSAVRKIHALVESEDALSPQVRRAVADRYAYYGRLTFLEGNLALGESAMSNALSLSRWPISSSVPIYNVAANAVGLIRFHRLLFKFQTELRRHSRSGH